MLMNHNTKCLCLEKVSFGKYGKEEIYVGLWRLLLCMIMGLKFKPLLLEMLILNEPQILLLFCLFVGLFLFLFGLFTWCVCMRHLYIIYLRKVNCK